LRAGESTFLKQDGTVYLCLLSEGIEGNRGLSLPPVSYESTLMTSKKCSNGCVLSRSRVRWIYFPIEKISDSRVSKSVLTIVIWILLSSPPQRIFNG
jgi:hypothetical protein